MATTWAAWQCMWGLALTIYASCKLLSWRHVTVTSSIARQLGYLFAWPGMDAAGFLDSAVVTAKPTSSEWLFASGKLLLGLTLLGVAMNLDDAEGWYGVGWVGMIGIAFTLHFGLFHLLSCAWRSVGAAARPIMNWPAASVRVHEFWGRRWNLAFRDLTHHFVFTPLSQRLGPRWALVLGFLLSGLVHDLVITVPVGGGHGGPTLYFLLQAGGILIERRTLPRQRIGDRDIAGWLWTMFVVLAPLPLLFPVPFVQHVVEPFLHALKVH